MEEKQSKAKERTVKQRKAKIRKKENKSKGMSENRYNSRICGAAVSERILTVFCAPKDIMPESRNVCYVNCLFPRGDFFSGVIFTDCRSMIDTRLSPACIEHVGGFQPAETGDCVIDVVLAS